MTYIWLSQIFVANCQSPISESLALHWESPATHRGEYDNFMAKSGILDLRAASKTLKCKDYGTADTKIGPLSRTSVKFRFVVLGAKNGSKMANFGYFW